MKILAAGVTLFFRKDMTKFTIATPNWFVNEPRKYTETNTFSLKYHNAVHACFMCCLVGRDVITVIVSLSYIFERLDGFVLISNLVWVEWRP